MTRKTQAPAPIALDAKFWAGFAADYWEKKPLALRNVRSSLSAITAQEIFDLLVLFANRCRKRKDPEGFKFYIDGFRAGPGDVLDLLPIKKDKSLQGYHDRMNQLFSDYCLVCDELLQVSAGKQSLLTEFTDELYRHVGFPNRFSEIGLYLGNYRKTPFGVHVDSCGVFSFPVEGKKRFRIWTSEFVTKNPGLVRAFKYEKFKKQSLVLEAAVGDMTYWPSSAWHIAESDGSFSATWSLGVWVDQSHVDFLSGALRSLLEKKSGSAGASTMTRFERLHAPTGEVTELPQAFVESIELLKGLDSRELGEVFLKAWMQHVSTQGFKNAAPGELKLTLKSRIRLRSTGALVLWRRVGEKCELSFAGKTVEAAGLLALIKAINAGEVCQVGSFLKGKSAKDDLLSLQALADAGAFSSP